MTYCKKDAMTESPPFVVIRGGASCQKVGWTRERSEQKMGVWDVGNFFGPRPPERRKTPLMQDRIKILFIVDFTFWTLFASHNYCISLSLEETALNPHLALRYKSRMTTTDQ